MTLALFRAPEVTAAMPDVTSRAMAVSATLALTVIHGPLTEPLGSQELASLLLALAFLEGELRSFISGVWSCMYGVKQAKKYSCQESAFIKF